MEWKLQAKGYVPFEHIHFYQDEVFEIKKGELKVRIEGVEHIVSAGETLTVPKGARHIASNNKEEELVAIVSYVPALDYEQFSKCFCGLTKDGYLDKNGGVNVPMMGFFLKKMKIKALTLPTSIPRPVSKITFMSFYLMGLTKGWNTLYKKYTN